MAARCGVGLNNAVATIRAAAASSAFTTPSAPSTNWPWYEGLLGGCQCYDGGRAFLTTLGHDGKDFVADGSFAGAAEFQKLIVGGIQSAAGMKPFCK